jgi:hypothetical protein
MHKCDANSVTKWKSSQMTTCDHFGAFGDVKGTSLMTTSLLVHGKMRRLPHQGARHSTVDHGDASYGVFLLLRGCLGRASTSSTICGCFLRVEQSFLWIISLLFFLSSLWMDSRANGSLSLSLSFSANYGTFTYLGLHQLHTREMGGRTDIGMGQAGPVRSPLRTRGSSWHFALCPSNCIILTMSSSHPRWRVFLHEVRSFTLQSSGIFLCNTSVLPPFGVISSCSQTRTRILNYSFELVVTPSFMFMFSCKNITLPNAHTKMNLLYQKCA